MLRTLWRVALLVTFVLWAILARVACELYTIEWR